MTLIKSISGIRGTIGGSCGEALTPLDIVKFVSAYSSMLHRSKGDRRLKVVVGRDARISGPMVDEIVCGTLRACGIDVVNAGLASTPTVEMAVIFEKADGGIILTASHNPKQWNALKLLNEHGEFLNAAEGAELVEIAEREGFEYCDVDSLGSYVEKDFTDEHIQAVLAHPLVDAEGIRAHGFKVVLDAVNSVGGIVMPRLLEADILPITRSRCRPTWWTCARGWLPRRLTSVSRWILTWTVSPLYVRTARSSARSTPWFQWRTTCSHRSPALRSPTSPHPVPCGM